MYRGREILQNQIAKNTFGYPSDGRPSFGVNPLSVFNGGRNGFWYDISDLRTLFQDVAGTTPVTADGQQVQLILDKSGNGNHASQLAGGVYHTDGTLHWITTNGTSNFYDIPYLGLYAAGAMTSVLGVSVLSQASDQYLLCEGSSASDIPTYTINREDDGIGYDAFIRNDASTILLDSSGGSITEGAGAIVISSMDTGSNVKSYISGVVDSDTDYTRSGVLTLNRTTLFALGRTTTVGFAHVDFYGCIIIADAIALAEQKQIEQYMANRSGVTL